MNDATAATGAGWVWEPEGLGAELEARGYEVDRTSARLPEGGGSLEARRERGDRTQLVVVDAGGRVRVRAVAVEAERRGRAEVAGALLRVVAERRVGTTATGTLRRREQFAALLDALDGPLPWTSVAEAAAGRDAAADVVDGRSAETASDSGGDR